LYIGLGILLYTQVQLSVLLYGWSLDRIPVASGMERRWATWSLLFVACVSFFALLLPAGSTALGLYLFMSFTAIAIFVGQLVAFVVLLLLMIILTPCLLLFRAQTGNVPPPPQFPNLPIDQGAAVQGDWLFTVRVLVFGVLVAVILLFIVRTYWRDRQAAGMWRALWGILQTWWSALRAWLSDEVRVVRRILKHGASPTMPEYSPSNFGWWRPWQARTARERVRRLYLALVQRAAEAGYPRQRAQTPYEYSSELTSYVPGNEEALSQLTEAFVEARYGRRDFDSGEVGRLHRLWRSLRVALHRS
jgi:hypothetical protein